LEGVFPVEASGLVAPAGAAVLAEGFAVVPGTTRGWSAVGFVDFVGGSGREEGAGLPA